MVLSFNDMSSSLHSSHAPDIFASKDLVEEGPLIGTAINRTVRLIRVVFGPRRTSTLVRTKLCLIRITASVPLTGLDVGIEDLPGALTAPWPSLLSSRASELTAGQLRL